MERLTYTTTVFKTGTSHTCSLLDTCENEIGYFMIYTNNDSIHSMNVSVNDEYQGKGFSRKMIRYLLNELQWSPETLLYIDTDASSGFWSKCGMYENKNNNGYEKVVTFKTLSMF